MMIMMTVIPVWCSDCWMWDYDRQEKKWVSHETWISPRIRYSPSWNRNISPPHSHLNVQVQRIGNAPENKNHWNSPTTCVSLTPTLYTTQWTNWIRLFHTHGDARASPHFHTTVNTKSASVLFHGSRRRRRATITKSRRKWIPHLVFQIFYLFRVQLCRKILHSRRLHFNFHFTTLFRRFRSTFHWLTRQNLIQAAA